MNSDLKSMADCLAEGDPIYVPSKFWEVLNEKNLGQLEAEGIENLKQTVAQNYFTWVIGARHEQFLYLLRRTPPSQLWSIIRESLAHDGSSRLSRKQQIGLGIFTRMLWKFAEAHDRLRILPRLEEPLTGNPFPIYSGSRLISQDLANSVLEFYSIREHLDVPEDRPFAICELGAGYGRVAYLFLKLFPNCRYLIIDIPPALYISQHYLSSLFPDRKMFKFRCFEDPSAVLGEFLSADIAFLLPHQASIIPSASIDLFLTISSLQEMTPSQIGAYFEMVDRVTAGCFYFKQWYRWKNPDDALLIQHDDYPVMPQWRLIFDRPARVQVSFFEALYAVGKP